MKICYDTSSIWFLLNVLAVSGFLVICLYKFIEVLRCLLHQPQTLKKTRNRVACKTDNKPEINTNKGLDVVVDSGVEKEALSKSHSPPKDSAVEPLPQFQYHLLRDATCDFALHTRMSADGLGHVFRADMFHTNEVFTIRRLKQLCLMTDEEFFQELSLLGQLNHPNVAKLIGYCMNQEWRVLVYEYSNGGILEDYLHGNKLCLDWKTRMKIVQGIARALQYLHCVMNPPILHCYIEPANISLDEDFTPKLSAAGVIRMFPTSSRTGCSYESITGSYGYPAVDYRSTKTINVVSDIYGFGLLLLEVITGRKGSSLGGNSEWVKPYFENGDLVKIVDPRLKGKIEEYELHEACAIAAACLDEQPANRIPIADLVVRMDYLAGYETLSMKSSLS